MPLYFVSRQIYWPGGAHVVEVASGGRDSANPDMLVEKWPSLGEGQEFADPREAVASAIRVARAWRGKETGRTISIAVGATGGFTLPFEPISGWAAVAWARERYDALPKCECGEPWPAHPWTLTYDPDRKFCSESCADAAYVREEEERAQGGSSDAENA